MIKNKRKNQEKPLKGEEDEFTKSKEETPNSYLLGQVLNIHSHRLFRRMFFLVILLHLLVIIIPYQQHTVFKLPPIMYQILQFFYNQWPFVKWSMGTNGEYFLHNLLIKGLEISVLLLYIMDLLPKILVWKKPLWWKLTNSFIVTLMVIQLPLTLRGYSQSGVEFEKYKFRILSIGLSFLLLCEIFSIREQKSIKLKQIQKVLSQQKKKQQNFINNKDKNNENLFITRQPKELIEYSWCEIIKHDRPGDAWIVINRYVYDISNYIDKHPGGDMLLDGVGGEMTHMWNSHHPQYLLDQGVPEHLKIGIVRDYFDDYNYKGTFYKELKTRVEKAIPKEKRKNDWRLFLKGILVFSLYLSSLVWYQMTLSFWSCICLALLAGQVGVQIMHDGNHVAYTSNSKFSKIMGQALDAIFSCSVVYRRSHNFGHHGCVNYFELDRAFDTSYPLIRLHNMQSLCSFHKYQHIYSFLAYGFVNWSDLYGTFEEIKWFSNFPSRRGFVRQKELIQQIIVKLTWLVLFFIIPSYNFGFIWASKMTYLWMTTMSYGYTMFFVVNHWTDEAEFQDSQTIKDADWGVLQVTNSSNYGIGSFWQTHISGGLNYQIEHHLFPTYCHTRLSQIQNITQQLCKERNIKYFSYSNFWTALQGHYRFLYQLGHKE